MTRSLVAMVIPVHNSWEHTREFLDSVRQVTYPNYAVIIVDDGSTDGTGQSLASDYPEVICLTGDGNLWSSGSVNLGIEKGLELGADYILQIDNDTVVSPDFLDYLVNTAEENPGSIVIPKVLMYDDPQRIDKAGYVKRWWGLFYYPAGHGEIDRGQYDTPGELLWADTMMLIDKKVISDIGMMDAETFPMYAADNDFTIRARRRGHKVLYEPKSRLWHKGHVSAVSGTPQFKSLTERWKYLTGNPKSAVQWKTQAASIRRHIVWYARPIRLALYLWTVFRLMCRRD